VEVLRQYVQPLYQPGDIVTLGEKVISMCQNNTVEMKDVRVGVLGEISLKIRHPQPERHRHGRARTSCSWRSI